MKYQQITQEERYQIYALKKEGLSQTAIAKNLSRDKGTISRELKRNKGLKGYSPKQADEMAKAREKKKPKKRRLNEQIIDYIREKIKLYWSPEQISGRMVLEGYNAISHETIYQYLLRDKKSGGELYKYLRHKNKPYRKRYGSSDKRGEIANKRSIEERPSIVEEKNRIGDWEIDLIIGKNHKQALVTVVDRKSKFTLIQKISSKKSEEVKAALISMMESVKGNILTITSDNGKEFAKHEEVATALNADFYFCHPYSSWERGLNENTNGLIRQFFPKGSEFISITDEQVLAVQNNLNFRPRKTLGFKTPNEIFHATITVNSQSA
jgi:IS30 family transposase